MTAKARAMNAVPKTALASRFAMKARADNKFSRKRSRRLGGSPAVYERVPGESQIRWEKPEQRNDRAFARCAEAMGMKFVTALRHTWS